MATTYGPQSIVTNGLTMYVDAGTTRSYNPVENLWATSETVLAATFFAGGTSALNAGAGPFGGAAWTITVTNSADHYLFENGPSLSLYDVVTYSVYVKSTTPQFRQIGLRFWTGAGRAWTDNRIAYFNLATETMYSSSGTLLHTSITNIENDWYRLSITARVDQAGFAAMSVYGTGVVTNGHTYQVAGFQIERNWGPTAYTATSGTAVSKPTTWTDLTGNGNDITLVNSPAFYAVGNSGALRFNGVNQEGYNSLNYTTGRHTFMVYNKYEIVGTGRILTSLNNNWLLGGWNGTIANYYAEGWVSPVSSGGNSTNWFGVAGTGDSTADWWELYRDGKLSLSNNGGSAGPNGLRIAVWSSSTERSTCLVGAILAYNRVLSADEIYRNHNALRGRYGI